MRHLGDRCPLWLALCHLALRLAAKAHRNLATESTFKATATFKRVFRRLCQPCGISIRGSAHVTGSAGGCSKHGAPLPNDLQDVARLCTRSDVNGDFRRTTRHHEPQAGQRRQGWEPEFEIGCSGSASRTMRDTSGIFSLPFVVSRAETAGLVTSGALLSSSSSSGTPATFPSLPAASCAPLASPDRFNAHECDSSWPRTALSGRGFHIGQTGKDRKL
jgi:hypothetical protein